VVWWIWTEGGEEMEMEMEMETERRRAGGEAIGE
jgi:hypothetical protein